MILLHVIISLAGIATGLVVLFGLIAGKRMNGWTAAFFVTNIATSVSGYVIPADRLLPSHIVGVLALAALGVGLLGRYQRGMSGRWRATYIVSSSVATYLNVFVAVVQAFQKVPALHALAPTQSEPPFAIAQAVVLIIFVMLTVMATRAFHEVQPALAKSAAGGMR